jgi:excisionase family DNA binding protein
MPQATAEERTKEAEDAASPWLDSAWPYLSAEEVARRLRVSRRTVYQWLRLGRLRGLRTGKAWRIRQEDLEAFLLPKAAWEQRLDDMLARVRSRIPQEITPEEIEADITAARDEVRQSFRAGGR